MTQGQNNTGGGILDSSFSLSHLNLILLLVRKACFQNSQNPTTSHGLHTPGLAKGSITAHVGCWCHPSQAPCFDACSPKSTQRLGYSFALAKRSMAFLRPKPFHGPSIGSRVKVKAPQSDVWAGDCSLHSLGPSHPCSLTADVQPVVTARHITPTAGCSSHCYPIPCWPLSQLGPNITSWNLTLITFNYNLPPPQRWPSQPHCWLYICHTYHFLKYCKNPVTFIAFMWLLLATWWQEVIHQKRLWCWERLRAGGEGGDRG